MPKQVHFGLNEIAGLKHDIPHTITTEYQSPGAQYLWVCSYIEDGIGSDWLSY